MLVLGLVLMGALPLVVEVEVEVEVEVVEVEEVEVEGVREVNGLRRMRG